MRNITWHPVRDGLGRISLYAIAGHVDAEPRYRIAKVCSRGVWLYECRLQGEALPFHRADNAPNAKDACEAHERERRILAAFGPSGLTESQQRCLAGLP